MGEIAIVIAESLASVIAAIRITSVRWRAYLPLKHRIWSSQTQRVPCVAIRIAWLAVIGVVFVPHRITEWLAKVDCVR